MHHHFRFKLANLSHLIAHAKAAPDHSMGYGGTKKKFPALLLVKDQGAYLMSNGMPRQLQEGTETSQVAYAEGCTPQDGWIGGDDFVEVVPVEQFEKLAAQGWETVIFDLFPTQMSISAEGRTNPV
jgi:hypothetical protein